MLLRESWSALTLVDIVLLLLFPWRDLYDEHREWETWMFRNFCDPFIVCLTSQAIATQFLAYGEVIGMVQ